MRTSLEQALAIVSMSASHCNDHIAKVELHARALDLHARFKDKLPDNLNRRLLLEQSMCVLACVRLFVRSTAPPARCGAATTNTEAPLLAAISSSSGELSPRLIIHENNGILPL